MPIDPPAAILAYLITAAVLDCIYISILSSTKIILAQVEYYKDALKDARTQHIAEQIEELFEKKTVFAMIISFAKSAAIAILGIIVYFITQLYIIRSESIATWQIILLSTLLTALISGFICYSIPRAYALRYAEQLLMPIYLFYRLNHWVLTPVGYLMFWVQNFFFHIIGYDEKYKFLSGKEYDKLNGDEENGDEGLNKVNKEMIHNIFEFGDTTAKEVMVPRIDIIAIPSTFSLRETLAHIKENGHSRVPVYEETVDSIIGILYVKDLVIWFSENGADKVSGWSLKKLTKEPYYIPASKNLNDLMAEMRTNQQHIAVVVDEYGGTAGLLTLEDILEEIVGDINDEYDDDVPDVQKIDERRFLVNPHIELDDLCDALDIEIGEYEEKEYSTLSGLFYHEFGSVPSVGTEFEFKGNILRITKMNAQKIEEIEITLPLESSDDAKINEELGM